MLVHVQAKTGIAYATFQGDFCASLRITICQVSNGHTTLKGWIDQFQIMHFSQSTHSFLLQQKILNLKFYIFNDHTTPKASSSARQPLELKFNLNRQAPHCAHELAFIKRYFRIPRSTHHVNEITWQRKMTIWLFMISTEIPFTALVR